MKSLQQRPVLFWLLLLWSCCAGQRGFAAETSPPPSPIDVLLWFDTEDYLLPADDDMCLRLATLLSERGIQATFKVVAEKARVLEQRNRHDVITALKRHAIGYHGNLHSVHPTPTEYLAECGWLDGIAEFTRRERNGAALVRAVFGVSTLACYGQPGSSWAPQATAALGGMGIAPDGIPCYVDEGSHVGYEQKPFWFAGALHVFHMGRNHTRMELHEPDGLEIGKKEIASIAERLARDDAGGLVSIYYHPCEWVHQEFWDSVNFQRGRNPPREDWKAPRQLPAEATEAALQRFAHYIDFIRTLPGVRFIAANDLPGLYPDLARRDGLNRDQLIRLAEGIRDSPSLKLQTIDKVVLSPADQFELIAKATSEGYRGIPGNRNLRIEGTFGPDSLPPLHSAVNEVPGSSFRDAVYDVVDFVVSQHRVPSRVHVGADGVAPGDFLHAMAIQFLAISREGDTAKTFSVSMVHGTTNSLEQFIAMDTPGLFGGWIIHPEGFRAPRVLEQARLQAWTLKPATRAPR